MGSENETALGDNCIESTILGNFKKWLISEVKIFNHDHKYSLDSQITIERQNNLLLKISCFTQKKIVFKYWLIFFSERKGISGTCLAYLVIFIYFHFNNCS